MYVGDNIDIDDGVRHKISDFGTVGDTQVKLCTVGTLHCVAAAVIIYCYVERGDFTW